MNTDVGLQCKTATSGRAPAEVAVDRWSRWEQRKPLISQCPPSPSDSPTRKTARRRLGRANQRAQPARANLRAKLVAKLVNKLVVKLTKFLGAIAAPPAITPPRNLPLHPMFVIWMSPDARIAHGQGLIAGRLIGRGRGNGKQTSQVAQDSAKNGVYTGGRAGIRGSRQQGAEEGMRHLASGIEDSHRWTQMSTEKAGRHGGT